MRRERERGRENEKQREGGREREVREGGVRSRCTVQGFSGAELCWPEFLKKTAEA